MVNINSRKRINQFVPKNDETVKKMLISKEDIFDYNLENLVSNLNREHMINSILMFQVQEGKSLNIKRNKIFNLNFTHFCGFFSLYLIL